MKLTREEFRKYIFSYTEDEAFYKKLYLQKKVHGNLTGFQIGNTLFQRIESLLQ